jgi:myo-inositol-1(or 4)-monophosphatase
LTVPIEAAEELSWLRGLAGDCAPIFARAAREGFAVDHKGAVDLVTGVDRELERLLVQCIRDRHPDDRILAEEGSKVERRDGAIWYVDPLDGTTNFVHGFPFYGPSVARWQDGKPQLAMVFAPALDELFLASAGGGAWLERPLRGAPPQRLRTRTVSELSQALCATGFPYDREGELAQLNHACHAAIHARSRGIRRAGSAALDLCYVAAGRLDAFWEILLWPWDVAAGALIALEAGACVSDFAGESDYLHGGRICCAATPALHRSLLQLLAEVHEAPARWSPGGRLARRVALRREGPAA